MLFKKSRIRFWFYIFLFYLCLFYSGLVLADYLIPRFASKSPMKREGFNNSDYALASKKQKATFLEDGFVPGINLNQIESNSEFRSLVKNYGIIGISNYPNRDILFCDEGYGWQTYKTDRYGFRNFNSQYEKLVEVAIFGDSFIQGGCVPTSATITQIMGRYANVLGFGLGGSDPIHYASMVRVMIPQLKPRQAGIGFTFSDFNVSDPSSMFYKYFFDTKNRPADYFDKDGNLSAEISNFYEKIFVTHQAALSEDGFSGQPIKVSLSDKIVEAKKFLWLNNVRALLYQYFPELIPLHGLSISSRIAIDELKFQCEQHKCIPFITYFAVNSYWNPNFFSDYYRAQLKYYAAINDINFISLENLIDQESLEDFSPEGGHYSIKAYEKVGQYLKEKLITEY